MLRPRSATPLVVCLVAALGACGTTGSGGTSVTGPTSGATHVSTAGGSASASSSPPAASTTPDACQLEATSRGIGAAAGHTGLVIVLTNTGTHACALSGYPAVTARDGTGATVATARPTPSGYLGGTPSSSATPATVDVPAGGQASTLLEWSTVATDGQTCTSVSGVSLTPPGMTTAFRLDLTATMCDPLVHPLVIGADGGR